MVRERLRERRIGARANTRHFRMSTPNRIRDSILHQVPCLHYPDRGQVISARVRISLLDFVLSSSSSGGCWTGLGGGGGRVSGLGLLPLICRPASWFAVSCSLLFSDITSSMLKLAQYPPFRGYRPLYMCCCSASSSSESLSASIDRSSCSNVMRAVTSSSLA